jgi:hypothetical protein
MKGRTKLGIIVGVVYGLMIAWGAFYQSLTDSGMMILATVTLGLGGGLIAGGLLFMLIAMCPSEEEERASTRHPDEHRAAA